MLESGDMGLDEPGGKYISGVQLYGEADLGTTVKVELQYDARGEWVEAYRASPVPRQSVVIPLLPRRCRTLKMRIKGQGGFTLYSITRNIAYGGTR